MEWKNIYRGLLMGASDVIPGVSGGTIAVLLGIYDRLIEAINGLFTKEWKKHVAFLIPLGTGMLGAILLLSKLIKWLFEYYPQPTKFFFLGLIIGILPYLFREADAKRTFRTHHLFILLIGAILCASLVFLHPGDGQVITEMTPKTYLMLLLAGIVASAAMILPGISGSFMLLVMGMYQTVIEAVSDLKLDILIATGFGIVLGLIFMSKVINYFFSRYRITTFALIIGLVIGSIVVVFPGWPITTMLVVLCNITFAAGLLTAYILGKVEYSK